MFNAITLSTGTTIQIPIYDAYTSSDYEVKTRSNAVLRDYQMNHQSISMSRCTDEELIELANILTGQQRTSLTINFEQLSGGQPYDGHWVILLFWFYNPEENKYYLHTPFTSGQGTGWVVNCALVGDSHFDGILFNYRYYRGYNASGYHSYTDFLSAVSYLKNTTPQPTIARPLMNVRPGSFYSLDFCFNNRSTTLDTFLPGNRYSESAIYAYIEEYEEETGTSVDYSDSTGTYYDPYGNIISQPGGGDGDPGLDVDEIEKAVIPSLPSLSAVDAGMITMYYCTNAQLQALAGYLWSNIYDLEANFVKLFSNPMDCIIGLGIVPVVPQLGSAANVKFGNITTNISMTKLSSQFQELDCGSIAIPKWIGCFMDYAPYVKVSLYLPYIGYRELSADDVVGDTIHVVYHIDCLTGGCCAMVETANKGLLYSFNGSCIADVPLTAINYSGAIQNAVSAVGAGLTMAAGVATGAAPLTAMGAASMLSNAANTAINSKPSVQRSGSMGGAAGLMSYQKPLLIVERPRMCVPNKLNHFKGNTLYVTRKLSNVKGFTTVEMINLEDVPATQAERDELTKILAEGVYF